METRSCSADFNFAHIVWYIIITALETRI